jgi:hypothetical protein
LPDAPRNWSLESTPRRQRKTDAPRLRKCKACNAVSCVGAYNCVACGADLRTLKERREVEIRLEQARRRAEEDTVALMRPRERLLWAGRDEQRLRMVARVSGYRQGWVHYRLLELRQRVRRNV